MLPPPVLIAPGRGFWPALVRHLLDTLGQDALSACRILVPAYSHARQLKLALAAQVESMRAPQINTLAGWIALQMPEAQHAASSSQRLTGLYDQLRTHAWLKKLFGARSNTDLLPLAQMLLQLSDELTAAHLPQLANNPGWAQECWQQALDQLPKPSQDLLSDEANLVWTLWQGQLAQDDGQVLYFKRLQQMAATAGETLIWISPELPDPLETAFLQAYAERQQVLRCHLDWREAALPSSLAACFPELVETATAGTISLHQPVPAGAQPGLLRQVRLNPASSLEQQAEQGAQTILNWLQEGRQQLAIIAQDRGVARRIAALLARAQVEVADETGWKLSTTRAASALHAWFEVVVSEAETVCLLDLLKSPFFTLRPARQGEQGGAQTVPAAGELLMQIELTLRRANVLGGWERILQALSAASSSQAAQTALMLVRIMRKQSLQYTRAQSIPKWGKLVRDSLRELGMLHTLARDAAGRQILQMLEQLEAGALADGEQTRLNFGEYRALLALQMEGQPFVINHADKRVVMLPLNGARLRHFDALLFVGCDADNLPSHAPETLFFANAVRRELGLATRESRQRQQMRDFCEMLLANTEVVLSWQEHKHDEPNPLSPWLQRLQLFLRQQGQEALPQLQVQLPRQSILPETACMPQPSAPMLLPEKLSASAYNRLFACPYQFFARQMLQVFALEEFSDLPQKRDYGDWLHEILQGFHDALQKAPRTGPARQDLLEEMSKQKFDQEMEKNAAALAYYARWQKTIPAYLQWLEKHEAQGWQYLYGEQSLERSLAWENGQVVLKGRIDRIDRNPDGELAVLDYKTGSKSTLSTRLKGGEDVQLPIYGLLAESMPEQSVSSASYLSIGGKEVETVAASDFSQWRQEVETHIRSSMQALQQGAQLPANGVQSVCQHCDVRGLCRKGAW